MDAKTQFQLDWLDANWEQFVVNGIEDAHGRRITIADAMVGMTHEEGSLFNIAFVLGGDHLRDIAAIITKTYLLETVVAELWGNHLADLEDEQ